MLEPPRRVRTQAGAVCVQVIRRSVRSLRVSVKDEAKGGCGKRNTKEGGKYTIPVDGSTVRERVSTATTWLEDLFHGQYFRQLAVETSSHE